MNHIQLRGLLSIGLLLVSVALKASQSSAYEEMSRHYEAIRLALLGDSLDDVNAHAAAIQELANNLMSDLSPENAGVADADAGKLEAAIREISVAASKLASVGDLVVARDDFFSLTKPMAHYRKLARSTGTIIAYCSMTQKAWIQPEGEIGNPYMGQKMPRCGDVVGE